MPLNPIHRALREAFTARFNEEDVQYIRYHRAKTAILLRDVGGILGHVVTTLSPRELPEGTTLDDVMAWMEERGAQAAPRTTFR